MHRTTSPLPSVAVELIQLSQQPEVSIDNVVKLLEQDSILAGHVLRIVKSPLYVGAMKPASLRNALVRLGLRTLRDIVMEIAMNLKVFKSEDYSETMDLLRRHSSATAHIAKAVSEYIAPEGDYAFLVGLLHDVGIAGTLLALSHQTSSQRRRKAPPDLIAIWPAVDRVHEQAAQEMAKHWRLPADLQIAIGAHHQVLIEGFAHPPSATIAVANELAHDLGYGILPNEQTRLETMTVLERDCVSSHTSVDRSTPKTLEHAQTALQLGEEQMSLIAADATSVLGEMRSAAD
jgi:HD-like signal output (HDOD) protein